jgi:hypothetical protein
MWSNALHTSYNASMAPTMSPHSSLCIASCVAFGTASLKYSKTVSGHERSGVILASGMAMVLSPPQI